MIPAAEVAGDHELLHAQRPIDDADVTQPTIEGLTDRTYESLSLVGWMGPTARGVIRGGLGPEGVYATKENPEN
jgi:hypothetical protein